MLKSMNDKDSLLWGFILATFGAVLFSSKGIFVKFSYQYGLSTELVLFYRMLLSVPVFIIITIRAVRRRSIQNISNMDRFKLIFCGFMGYYLAGFLSFYSLHYISVQLERVILFSYPALVVLGTAILARKLPTLKMIVAAILTYLGVFIIFGHEFLSGGGNALSSGNDVIFGALMVGVSALVFAVSVLVSKNLIAAYGSAFYTGSVWTVSTIFIVLHTLIFYALTQGNSLDIPSVDAFWILVALSMIGTVIPSFMISEAIARIGPERTAISGTVGPIATSMIAISFLGEEFTIYHGAALILCSAGIILIARKNA
ncbi:DMT family transporter [Kordiimonas sp. SCSIO 12610]|uniref:DMT family transporter n=1 Tax=Kordiimonas sp. SCSIO 12610 TaxID=2829597 RepID=UPI002109163B|nr:DMT family transporter [Kordiimonas sp. SCSIO 12610]UTW54139.1 DMT family transporter [Kordiimonas sp. SCSIO 12610]